LTKFKTPRVLVPIAALIGLLCLVATSAAGILGPVNGASVGLQPHKGTVTAMLPGQPTFAPLVEAQTVPVGTIVDATDGKVRLNSVDAAGKPQSALFYGGRFEIFQQRDESLVVLELRGGDFSRCDGDGYPRGRAGAQASARKKGGRQLWGSGKGDFRSKGNFGAATVRGTTWFTEDNCGGTFFKVKQGVVSVRDYPDDRTLSLPPGKGHWAKAK
jgi:hypothetical protein